MDTRRDYTESMILDGLDTSDTIVSESPANNCKDTGDVGSEGNPPCPLPQATTIGGGIPLWAMGAQHRHLILARGSADSSCLLARRYLYHAPPRPHTRPHTHKSPLQVTTFRSHLLPAHTVPPHSHLYFAYKLPVWHVLMGLVSAAAKDRATIHIHSTLSVNARKHPTPPSLDKVYKRVLVVPPSTPRQRTFICGACTGTAQVGVSLVSLFAPLFKRSRLHCLGECLT